MASSSLAVRVSRRELVLNRHVWLAQAGMFAVLALSTALIAVGPFGFDTARVLALSAGLAVVAVSVLFSRPQPVDSLGNHLAVASSSVGTGAAMLAFGPHPAAAAAAIMFVGPLAAARLVDRTEIGGHLALGTLCLLGPAVYLDASTPSLVGLGTLVIGIWVLGGCCVWVFETAEAQGEALEQLVRRDPLTGIGNRRMLNEQLARALRRHQRTNRPLTLLAIDLDGFKAVNDAHGHAVGDELLAGVAAALTAAVGPGAQVARLGGDEFSVLLPGLAPEQAAGIVQELRAALLACGVTAGIGMASFPRDAVHDKVLMQLADERLLADKRV